MFTGMDSLLSQGRRDELAREVESGRLERKLGTVRRPDLGRRWAFWLPREIGDPAGVPSPPKIRRLRDAGHSTWA